MLKDVSSFLTEQPESMDTNPTDSTMLYREWTRVFAFPKAYMDSIIAAIEKGENDCLSGEGYLTSWKIRGDGPYPKLYATYCSTYQSGDISTAHQTNTPEYYLMWVQDDIPVERLSNYLAKWNHVLAQKIGTTGSLSTYDTAKNTELGDDDAKKFHWYKDSSQLPEGWKTLKDPTKPGLDMKMNYRATIKLIVWCSSYKDVLKFANKEMKVEEDVAKNFGIIEGNWLVTPSDVSPDGTLFRVETLYINAPANWDSDVYA